MLRRYIYPIILLFVFLGFMGSYFINTAFHLTDAQLVAGSLPGAAYSGEKGKVLRLTGEWSYKPGLADPSETAEGFLPVRLGRSGYWTAMPGRRLKPATGAVTYRCTVDTEGLRGISAFRIPPIASAYALYVNGDLLAESGRVSPEAMGEIPLGRPQLTAFTQDTDRLVVHLQVSNHFAFSGGFPEGPVEYGTYQDVLKRQQRVNYRRFVYFLFLSAFAFLFMIQSLYHKKEWYHFYLGLGTFAFGLIYLLRDPIILPQKLITLPWPLLQRLETIIFITFLVLILNHGRHFYHRLTRSRASVTAQIIGGLGIITTLVLPTEYFRYLQPFVSGGALAVFIYLFGVAVRALRRKERFALLYSAGMFLLLVVSAMDLLRLLGFLSFVDLLWMGLLVYCVFSLLILFLQAGSAYTELGGVYTRLEEVVQERDSLLTRVSGEVGSSMERINDLTRSMIQGSLGPLNSEQMVSASLILSQSMHHQFLLNDIMDFSSLQDESLKLSFKSMNLFHFLHLSIASFRPVVMGLEVDLANRVSRDFPALWADERRLGQVFYNILSFGVQIIKKGEILIDARAEEDRGRIIISYRGIEKSEKIEEGLRRFSQETPPEPGDRGGITILRHQLTRKILQLHGSPLEMNHSAEDEILLEFTLPFSTEEEELLSEEMAIHLDALENLQPLLDEVVSDRDIAIHIVSGDSTALQVMKSQLAAMNYQIIPFLKGLDCLNRVAEELPQMVVVDSSLPDMNGYALCRELREQYTPDELPILMVVGENQGGDSMESLTSGANDYLRKPYQQEEFLTRVNTHLQLSRINSIYSQFVPKEFLKSLGQENIADLRLGDQVQREMTILFVDIRAFTNLSENMTPQENFKFINSYLSQFTPIITRNNGFVDKFIGDAIMALYPEKPEDAIRTAIEMVDYVKIYNGYRAKCGYRPINIGVGIHTGNLILGIIGDSQRMQGTVISDSVNLAARIQDVTKLYKANVVISQETFVKLENPTEFNFRFLGKVKVKGKAKSVSLFEVFNSDNEALKNLKEDTKGEFETAILLFAKREFAEAEKLFEKVLRKNPEDSTAKLFLDRARKFMASEKRTFLTSL